MADFKILVTVFKIKLDGKLHDEITFLSIFKE